MKRLILCGVLLAPVTLTGCLSTEQRVELRTTGANLAATLKGLYAQVQEFDDEIKAIWIKVKAKEIPFTEGVMLVEEFRAQKAGALVRIEELKAEKARVEKALKGQDWSGVLEGGLQILIGALLGGGAGTVASRKRRGVGLVTGRDKT